MTVIYASRDERKSARQTALLEAIARESVSTQHALVRALRRRGIPATQVSVSRDIAELGLMKAGGRYRPAPAEAGASDPESPLRTWVRRAEVAGPHLVVVRCDVGTAQRVGLALDGLALPGVAGTLAGDDTVFVAAVSEAASRRVVGFLRSRMRAS